MPDAPEPVCPCRYLLPVIVIVAVAAFCFSLLTTNVIPLVGTPIVPATPNATPTPSPSLAGTSWTLTALDGGNGTIVAAVAGSNVTAEFEAGGQLSGNAGCNRYFGEFSSTETTSSVSVTGAGSTKMFCHDPGIMQQEDAYLVSMDRWAKYSIAGSELTIRDGSGDIVAEFTRAG